MRITNHYSLPDTLYNALSHGIRKPVEGRYSITDLCNPPMIRHLKMKHWDELEEDASGRLWALLGQAVHYVLENHAPQNALAEEKMEAWYGDYAIVGKPDLWQDDEISDWKITSVYSFLLGDKPEWEKQLNLYVWLYDHFGFTTSKLTINAILRDWQQSKAKSDSDYPQIPFHSVDIPLWDINQQGYAVECAVDELSQVIPRSCTPEERWQRPTTYAVMKEGRKKAVRVFDTQDKAFDLATITKDGYVETRKGGNIRCESYCPVRTVCTIKEG